MLFECHYIRTIYITQFQEGLYMIFLYLMTISSFFFIQSFNSKLSYSDRNYDFVFTYSYLFSQPYMLNNTIYLIATIFTSRFITINIYYKRIFKDILSYYSLFVAYCVPFLYNNKVLFNIAIFSISIVFFSLFFFIFLLCGAV
jgi:hypothetical protein